jgi:hypothetical protein
MHRVNPKEEKSEARNPKLETISNSEITEGSRQREDGKQGCLPHSEKKSEI